MNKKGLLILWAWVMVAILAIDYDLGVEAQYLNPWFLLLEISGETAPGPFVFGQESLGVLAKPFGLVAWILEGALVTWLLLVVMRGVHKIISKGSS